ncbi:MAG TPA: MraY family glycosyltransferase [Acidimicrobiales bacterium]|nr:MraY family glycosyltransferase [Acidimicrobiales bacterium]
MRNPAPWEYAVALVACGALTMVLTPLALEFALRRGILDWPGPDKSQREAVPYLGGVVIVVAFSAVVLAAAAYRPYGADLGALGVTLGLGLGLALLGLVDDLRSLPIPPRLALEAVAGVVVYLTGTHANLRGANHPLDAVVTVLWVVGVTNAFNLLDNMDGLAAGVAGLSALALFTVGVVNHQYFVPLLALALVGCAAGFLPHNFFPARIYMGDAGSLFMGFVIAVLCLRLRAHAGQQVTFAVPVLVLAVPIFDTALVATTRALRRTNPLRGARDHVSHRLVARGLPPRRAVTVIYLFTAATGALAVGVSPLGRAPAFAGLVAVAAASLVLGVRLAGIPASGTASRGRAGH